MNIKPTITALRVQAATIRDDAPPGGWEDTSAKLLLMATQTIERMNGERLALDRRIHNQRIALRKNWEITEMRAEYKRAWYPSKLLRSILGNRLNSKRSAR